jgi:hypothetical protein
MSHVWGRGEVLVGSWWENLRERDPLQELGIGGKIMLKWFFKKSGGWIDLSWGRGERLVHVIAVKNLQLLYNGSFLAS